MRTVPSSTPSVKLFGPWVQHMMTSSLHPSTPPPKDSSESEYSVCISIHTWPDICMFPWCQEGGEAGGRETEGDVTLLAES